LAKLNKIEGLVFVFFDLGEGGLSLSFGGAPQGSFRYPVIQPIDLFLFCMAFILGRAEWIVFLSDNGLTFPGLVFIDCLPLEDIIAGTVFCCSSL
jgi:hypothetical protein